MHNLLCVFFSHSSNAKFLVKVFPYFFLCSPLEELNPGPYKILIGLIFDRIIEGWMLTVSLVEDNERNQRKWVKSESRKSEGKKHSKKLFKTVFRRIGFFSLFESHCLKSMDSNCLIFHISLWIDDKSVGGPERWKVLQQVSKRSGPDPAKESFRVTYSTLDFKHSLRTVQVMWPVRANESQGPNLSIQHLGYLSLCIPISKSFCWFQFQDWLVSNYGYYLCFVVLFIQNIVCAAKTRMLTQCL